ncbi:MAG: TonB-dependent receptor, partial [Neisseriaceae bacterium]|nr:TonB-dependent receptor [Neisseriaceae bacterium]
DVVVTASGFEQRLKNAPASITVITEEELANKNATSLAEVLKEVPGVDIRNGADKTGVLSIEMRGMPAEYTLIMIDGRRQNTSGSVTPNGFGGTSFGFMPPLSSIKRIEVIRGPMSTLYGSDAMGGVINIITKPVATREWGGNVTAQTEWQQDSKAANTESINVQASGPLIKDTLGVEVRGRLFNREPSERLNPQASGRDPRPGRGQNHDVGAKVSWLMNDRNTLWVDVGTAKQWYDNRDSRLGSLDSYHDDGRPKNIAGYEDKLTFSRDQYAMGHQLELDAGTLDTSVSQVRTETKGRTLPPGNAPDLGYVYRGGEARTLKNTDTIVQSKFRTELGQHSVNVGLEYQRNRTEDAAAGRGNRFKQNAWAVFGEDSWQFMPQLNLTLGGRYEHHKAFGGEFTPRAYLTWQANNEWTMKGGVSGGYKVPTLNDLHDGINGFTRQGQRVTMGSPDLKPEKTTSYELSANYAQGGFDTTATVFLNQFRDKIGSGKPMVNCDFAGSPNQPGCISIGGFPSQDEIGTLVNIDKAQTKGLELASRYDITPEWSVKGTYTWLKTETKSGANSGSFLVSNPRHALNVSTNYQFNERLGVWLEAEYKSSRERYQGKTTADETIIKDATNNKFKGYTIVNLGLRHQINKQLRLTAGIDNLLDKKFDEYQLLTNSSGKQEAIYAYSHAGRSNAGTYIDRRKLWLSLGYDF